jgi:hypothetical protein
MRQLTLPGHEQKTVEIDVCDTCRAFWFDRYESLQLSPGATLKLFSMMAEQGTVSPPPTRRPICPRCGKPLILAHDWQFNTPFQYWRCEAANDGRFIMFVEFLREKQFVRAPTPQEVADLKTKLQTVHCENCGAPIDLAQGTVCPHCRSPLSIVDQKQMQDVAARLQAADRPPALDPTVPVLLWRHEDMHPAGAQIGDAAVSLVQVGLQRIVKWLQTPR